MGGEEIRQLAYRRAQSYDSRDMEDLESLVVRVQEPPVWPLSPVFNVVNARTRPAE